MHSDERATFVPNDVRERLQSLLYTLDDSQLLLLERMAIALGVPVGIERESSDIVDNAFAKTLANFLLLHHAIHEEPLNKAAFEYVLRGCATAGGHSAVLNTRQGTATWDVLLDDQRLSLKTEAARGMSRDVLKIEKLMEARWIRDCTNPAKCAAAVRREVPAHMSGYDRIFVLRAFRLAGDRIRYEIVEPPKDILVAALSDIGVSAFTKEGKKESYGANVVAPDGSRVFRILLDSSVEKVRLWFRTDHCIRHGAWTLLPAAVQGAAAETTT
jgi:Type II site-specific deoxyribonuclease